MPWRGVISCVTGAQHNSAAAPSRCAMAHTSATNAQGRLLEKVLSVVEREKLVIGIDETKKVVEFVHPEELKVISSVTAVIIIVINIHFISNTTSSLCEMRVDT